MTHQQAYYVWIERVWRAGMRMMVAQTADDEPICRIEPRRRTKTCSETASVVAQIATLKGLQNYVDAQSGGPGRGWFRLVYSPAQARKVIEEGKLAVLIGIESSDLFGCSELQGGLSARAPTSITASPGTSGSAYATCSSPIGSTTRLAAPRSRVAPRACSSTSLTVSRPAPISRPRAAPGRVRGSRSRR